MRAALTIFVALWIVTALPSGIAHAADASTEEARQHFRSGQQLFDLGRWDEAAQEFEKAYQARSDPTFIYNMAQAYRRKGDLKRALDLYKNYLIKAPKSPQRAEVEVRIDALEKQLAEADRPAKASTAASAPGSALPAGASGPISEPPLPDALAPAATPAPAYAPGPAPLPSYPPAPVFPSGASGPIAQPPPPAPFASPSAPAPLPSYAQTREVAPTEGKVSASGFVETPAQPSTSPGRGLRIGGIVCGAAGLAFVVAGIFFGVEAEAYANSVEKSSIFQPNYDDRGRLYEKLQYVGYGVGAGLVATGALLYVLGARSARASGVALVPALLPGGAGLSARGAY